MSETARVDPAGPEGVRVLQITDTHIASDPADRYDGVDTAATLAAVIARVNRLSPPADLILLSGDLADDPTPVAYRRLLDLLAPLRAPVFCLPGNHDDPVILRSNMNRGRISTPRAVQAAQWLILLLDTWLPGTHGGLLSEAELDFLRRQLANAGERHVLVCLHHPPVAIGSPWMDAMALENPERLFTILDRSDQVRAVIWGHIHQVFESERRGVLLLGSPSTCVQF
ncbi:MAG: phosphodiesterase, partial [Gammaproteobacteria bacterium]|nr:phosphodiesterase [Gammaproteobacteria bacterium]